MQLGEKMPCEPGKRLESCRRNRTQAQPMTFMRMFVDGLLTIVKNWKRLALPSNRMDSIISII